MTIQQEQAERLRQMSATLREAGIELQTADDLDAGAAALSRQREQDEAIIDAVERIARSEAAIFADAGPMSFGDGCRSAYLNIVAQITSRRREAVQPSAALSQPSRQLVEEGNETNPGVSAGVGGDAAGGRSVGETERLAGAQSVGKLHPTHRVLQYHTFCIWCHAEREALAQPCAGRQSEAK